MTSSHPNTDQDILEDRTPGTNPDLDVVQRANTGSDTSPLAGTQSAEADTHNPGPIPVAGSTSDQLRRAGQPGAQTDTTIGENYTGGPISEDPEQQLLDPGYDPQIPSTGGRRSGAGARSDVADNPGLSGMPDQAGALDQTTYHSEG